MEQEHTTSPAPEEHPSGSSVGSVIAILLIVFLLVVGAFYVWGQRISEQRALGNTPADTGTLQ